MQPLTSVGKGIRWLGRDAARPWIALIVVLMMVFGLSAAGAGDSQPVEPLSPPPVQQTGGQMVNETGNFWFVELMSPPTTDGTKLETVQAEKKAFRAAAKQAGLIYKERFAFDTLWNGLSVEVNRADLGKLSRINGVKNLYPVTAIKRPEPMVEGAKPELLYSVPMIGADVVQSELGFTGAGIKVGVIDTGIDYNHPDLGGGFGPGYRVITGYDFVGNAYTGPGSTPVPDPDPMDCDGHGTHVAGIVGANGRVLGVAPGVKFGAYKVFGCEGLTQSDIMIAAMEQALADGMQVVNISVGEAYDWPQFPAGQAATRLVNKGVVVAAAIGNEGDTGLYSGSDPGLGNKVIGVASFDNTRTTLPTFTVGGQPVGYIAMIGAPLPPTAGTYEIVDVGLACSTVTVNLGGKVALIERGTCTFRNKALQAQAAGAVAVVIYNNVPGIFAGSVAGDPPLTIPVVGISQADGQYIISRADPTMMTWTDQLTSLVNPTGGLISSFSAYGLSPDLALKPDIGAPGGTIYSTYPVNKGSYATLSGTSMATPHVAGAAALLLEAKPRTPSQAVRSRLQNSAEPRPWGGNPGLGFLDNVHRQGAGLLKIDSAILATTTIEPGKIAAGEGQAGPFTQVLTIKNGGAAGVTYDLSAVNALSTGGVITPTFSDSDASVAFSTPSIFVPAGGSATVTATITPATRPDKGQYGGYLVFTPQGGGQEYSVPFAGFVGDYQSIQAMTPGTHGMPWLAKMSGNLYFNQPNGASFTMAGDDIPWLVYHFDHQPRQLLIDIFDAVKGTAWHRALRIDYLQRNSDADHFFGFGWDGQTTQGGKVRTVPNGKYVARISILKALGDSANPAHWETWTSPVITINRP